ncbi:1193_t:CDS:1, partial [Entrophospora sp. SA101]
MHTVIIIGAGIGGLLFAQGLLKNHSENKMNFNVKIFERDAGPE